ncbi:ATP-binding cassette domain-containing protein [Cytobacillus sp. FSL W7-1323]|uniref:ATP-binding cassette domain-containing protein n=1 Tax=unclassified Cytobacillus TaxID=2675268 RepID=UPI002AFFCC31|nr:ATP-binding cassette domain-containing protein [Cytobacillus sp. OWB-43]MEA1855667.1 ATP-binding cassette domain-containing protein [Cytobacillus sp. OWB-43]
MNRIIETRELTKVFNEKEIISNVNITVNKGEIYGFLGPNGAGKTTVMKMVANLIKPTRGEIDLFEKALSSNSYQVLGKIGAIIEQPVFYEKLSARKNLELHCEYMGYHNKNAVDESLEMVKLTNTGAKPVKEFSMGMKQRLAIARAIMTKPELLILDEPINGLDPVGIKEIRKLFKKLNKEYGITIFISSHILAEIEHIADKIGVIIQGKLMEEIPMEKVRENNKDYIEIVTKDSAKVALILEHHLKITNTKMLDSLTIRVYDLGVPQGVISEVLFKHGVVIESIYHKSSSLEDYFFTLLNGGGVSA